MPNSLWMRICICVGAVVGAGFASGREIVSFFSQYGVVSWGMILLAAVMMGSLCWLILHRPNTNGTIAQLCTDVLWMITAGAMIAAAGQMIALVWESEWAYSIGAVGTLLAAWKCSRRSLQWLGVLGGISTGLLLAVLMGGLLLPGDEAVRLPAKTGSGWIRAAAYAGMNMTLAMGVIGGCRQAKQRENQRTAIGFGAVMLGLLLLSNALYLHHPLAADSAFPIVRLLSGLGRMGFILSAVLLYLAIFTTLASLLYALHASAEKRISHPFLRHSSVLGMPLLISCLGFDGIVGSVYAPVGLLCLCVVFGPMFFKSDKETLDNPARKR